MLPWWRFCACRFWLWVLGFGVVVLVLGSSRRGVARVYSWHSIQSATLWTTCHAKCLALRCTGWCFMCCVFVAMVHGCCVLCAYLGLCLWWCIVCCCVLCLWLCVCCVLVALCAACCWPCVVCLWWCFVGGDFVGCVLWVVVCFVLVVVDVRECALAIWRLLLRSETAHCD